ncbi:hypothetical protein U7230_04010 [Carboxydochorda subterranea]|uniref:Methyl-accepting transducer domain-containing protein n=1 Tax=Carboxydichorda subterranea TaxID=3109565 RepID=A0ABZ1C1K4_9FIRM|nr:hypothetical protein [Limnochorda sp. L945t]WRP18178.1 hypothetical protein U7230_04010 [Limnochorda sp. L945t]
MSQQGERVPSSRVPGVAGVSALAAPSANARRPAGHFVAVTVIVLVLGIGGAIFAGGRVGRNVTDAFAALYDAWDHQSRSLEQLQGEIRGMQQQLTEWGALDQNSGPQAASGVLVISRDQAAELAQRLRSLGSDMDSLRRVIGQRQSIIGQTSERVRRDATASLWSVALGILVAGLIGSVWLARVTVGPMGELRRRLEVADQGQQALASALGSWMGRIGDGVRDWRLVAESQSMALASLRERLDAVASATSAVAGQAEGVARAIEEFDAMAERVRDFGGESKVLALSAAIEGARLEAQGRSVAVVAEELRRVASEAREVVRQVWDLKNRLDEGADRSRRAAAEAGKQIGQIRESLQQVRDEAIRLARGLLALQERAQLAGQAAQGWAAKGAGSRSSLELRAAVDRALSGEMTVRPATAREVSREERVALAQAKGHEEAATATERQEDGPASQGQPRATGPGGEEAPLPPASERTAPPAERAERQEGPAERSA